MDELHAGYRNINYRYIQSCGKSVLRWIGFIHLFHLYIKTIFIHFNLLKRYFVYFIIFLPGVLEMLRVLWYHPATFSKNNLGFLAGIHH